MADWTLRTAAMTVRTLRAAARWMRVIVRNWRKLTKKSCRRSLNAINSCNILKMLYSVFRRRSRLYKSINPLTERIYSALPASHQGNRMEFLCYTRCPKKNCPCLEVSHQKYISWKYIIFSQYRNNRAKFIDPFAWLPGRAAANIWAQAEPDYQAKSKHVCLGQ